MPRAGTAAARGAAGLSGLPMATYTAVLIANTAVPVWHEARHELPFVFAGERGGERGRRGRDRDAGAATRARRAGWP